MKLSLLDGYLGKVSINDVYCYIESLTHESEFSVYIDDPFYKESSRCILHLGLDLLEVLVVNTVLGLLL